MNWRFRTSFSPPPDVLIALAEGGVVTSVGAHGISNRSLPQNTPEAGSREMTAIRSVGSGLLTTPGLSDFKRLLDDARGERNAIVRELNHARSEEVFAEGNFRSWEKGWFMRRCFKAKFEKLRGSAEETSAIRVELEEQQRLAHVQTEFELPEGVAEAFQRLSDVFAVLRRSNRIWDTVSHRETNQFAERTAAVRKVERKPVEFQYGKCDLIESGWRVPHLENANGGDLYLYPLFVLYFISEENFALLEYKDIDVGFSSTQMMERESLPDDAVVVGQTWEKTNKDGSPDQRFKDNRQIPIAKYGQISIRSTTGMNEEYLVSCADAAEAFSLAWSLLSRAVAAGA